MLYRVLGSILVFAGSGGEDEVFNVTGGIIMYGGPTAPAGWLLCDGAAVSRVTYAALFALIGTTFGAGNGTTTFNVPAFVDKFPVSPGGIYGNIGTQGGVVSHSHTVVIGQDLLTTERNTETVQAESPVITPIDVASSDHRHAVPDAETSIDTNEKDNAPPYLVVNFIIKT